MQASVQICEAAVALPALPSMHVHEQRICQLLEIS